MLKIVPQDIANLSSLKVGVRIDQSVVAEQAHKTHNAGSHIPASRLPGTTFKTMSIKRTNGIEHVFKTDWVNVDQDSHPTACSSISSFRIRRHQQSLGLVANGSVDSDTGLRLTLQFQSVMYFSVCIVSNSKRMRGICFRNKERNGVLHVLLPIGLRIALCMWKVLTSQALCQFNEINVRRLFGISKITTIDDIVIQLHTTHYLQGNTRRYIQHIRNLTTSPLAFWQPFQSLRTRHPNAPDNAS